MPPPRQTGRTACRNVPAGRQRPQAAGQHPKHSPNRRETAGIALDSVDGADRRVQRRGEPPHRRGECIKDVNVSFEYPTKFFDANLDGFHHELRTVVAL